MILIDSESNLEIELNIPEEITEKPQVIYEDENIKISTTGRDYDFIATVQNKTSLPVRIAPVNDDFSSYEVGPNNWVGISANMDGYVELAAYYNDKFEYYVG